MKYIIERNNYDGNGWRELDRTETREEASKAISRSIEIEEAITGSCFSNHRVRKAKNIKQST